jgi:hypothetical protein
MLEVVRWDDEDAITHDTMQELIMTASRTDNVITASSLVMI